MKRTIIIILLVLASTAFSSEPAQQGKAVTVSQEYTNDINPHEKALIEDLIEQETEKRYDNYLTHLNWNIGIFGVLFTVIVGAIGFFVPYIKGKADMAKVTKLRKDIIRYKKDISQTRSETKEIKEQIENFKTEIENFKTETERKRQDFEIRFTQVLDELNRIKGQVEEFQKAAQTSAENANEAKESAEKITLSGQYFYQAINEPNLDKKTEFYSKAIELNPNLAAAYCSRGNAYSNKGEYDKAFKDYDKAIELNPNYAEAYHNRGNAYKFKGELDKAIMDYNTAIKLNPNYAPAYYNRGIAYDDKGEYDKAIKDYDKAIERNPNYAKSYNGKANAYFNMGDLPKALENANIAINKYPIGTTLYDTRANIYIVMAKKETDEAKAKEHYQKALDDCKTGLSLNPNEECKKLLEQKKKLCEEKLGE